MTIKLTDFSLATTSGKTLSLSDLKGQFSIVYFYPKDSTPGCTLEGQDFRDHFEAFKTLGAEIYGVSRDSVKSHENFKCKQSFPFELISDPDETLCKLFDVIKLKNMYGKEVLGIERSTFIINPKGEIAAEWRKVSVKGHVLEVLEKLKTLAS